MTNKNPNRAAAHNERKPASDQPTAQRKPSEAPGLITRSAYSAEPSRRAAPKRRTARQGRPSGRAPGTTIGGCHACAAVGRAPGMRKGAFRRPLRRRKGPQGATSPAGLSRRMRRTPPASAGAPPRARPGNSERRPVGGRRSNGADRKAPSASATPCPPAALRCSTLGEGGLNCRVRDGTG